MNWYLAKIIFRIICGEGDHTAQFDEQLRLIKAHDEGEAFSKAKIIGESGQDKFFNDKQKLVQWQFINVAELYKLSALIDGAELYSRIYESEEAGPYIEFIHKKAEHIQHSGIHQFLELL